MALTRPAVPPTPPRRQFVSGFATLRSDARGDKLAMAFRAACGDRRAGAVGQPELEQLYYSCYALFYPGISLRSIPAVVAAVFARFGAGDGHGLELDEYPRPTSARRARSATHSYSIPSLTVGRRLHGGIRF